jgi:hypothetical protein
MSLDSARDLMQTSVANQQAARHPLNHAEPLGHEQIRNAAKCKELAEQDWRGRIGYTILRALEIAHISKLEMSHAMGYADGDQSTIARWIRATERPLFDRLFAAREGLGERFYDAWVVACAEQNPRLEVTTTIRVKRA